MNRFTSPREAYEAYVRGAATLDEVSLVANRTIMEHLKRTGRTAEVMPTSEELRLAYEEADEAHRTEHGRLFPVYAYDGTPPDRAKFQRVTSEDLARLDVLARKAERLRREWTQALMAER